MARLSEVIWKYKPQWMSTIERERRWYIVGGVVVP
jgi:hypothetical protein